MRIVVSGASGLIGRTVVDRLAGAGHRVLALMRAVPRDTQLPRGVEPLETGDLVSFAGWPRALDGADGLVHLAAIAHRSNLDERRLEEVNVLVAEKAARAACAAKARFLFLSTAKVHGEESSRFPFYASNALTPQDVYARTKAAAERALSGVAGLKWTILRPPLVYGPGVKANFFALMRAIARGWPLPFASIENRRSLVYVGNLCDAIIRCLEAPHAAGRTYLVSDGAPVSTPQLCRALGDALGRPARLFPFPASLLELHPGLRRLTRSLEVDDSAIRRELGWQPRYTFEEGLRLTAEWYRARGG